MVPAATEQNEVVKGGGLRDLTGIGLVPDQDLQRSCEFGGRISEVEKCTDAPDDGGDQYDGPELKVIPEKTAEPDRLLFLYGCRGLSG